MFEQADENQYQPLLQLTDLLIFVCDNECLTTIFDKVLNDIAGSAFAASLKIPVYIITNSQSGSINDNIIGHVCTRFEISKCFQIYI